MILASPMSVAA
jgi:hypothetical protein